MRHFDAPEAVETRFYEVRAKSILNRVPEASQMPFRWTINVYRGCTHACTYCAGLRDAHSHGRRTAQADLRARGRRCHLRDAGGGIRLSALRSHDRSRQVDHGQAGIPTHARVRDGADPQRGSSAAEQSRVEARAGQPARPARPAVSDHSQPPRRDRTVSATAGARRRLSLADICAESSEETACCGRTTAGEPVADGTPAIAFGLRSPTWRRFAGRASSWPRSTSPPVRVYSSLPRAGTRRSPRYRPRRRSSFERVSELVEWPMLPSLQWCRGFLAGIFDAEGSRSDFALRIANTDPEILEWTEACSRRLGFDVALDRTRSANGLRYIRIRGGLSEHLRFFHLTDPAITRKRNFEGQIVKTFENLRVAEIEPIGREMPLYDITTGTGDFIANGVVSHNCFARPTHKYLGLQRRPGLRARDRGQGERARTAASGVGAAEVDGRARGARDEHRPVSVGRGAIQADARNLGGDARRGQSLLGADQISIAVARPAADEADRRADGVRRRAVGANAGRASMAGDRAAFAEPEGAARGGGGAEPGGNPDRSAGGAADARDQRRARAGLARSSNWRQKPARRT